MTYRKWVEQGNKKFFLHDVKERPARFREVKGVAKWDLLGADLPGGIPTPGSEIVDADGTVWVVEKVLDADVYVCTSKKKVEPKKE